MKGVSLSIARVYFRLVFCVRQSNVGLVLGERDSLPCALRRVAESLSYCMDGCAVSNLLGAG